MSSYFIFALVLTVLYVVYYAVVIARDLYGEKGTEQQDEEVFDLGPEDITEESVNVSENENGFSVGKERYGTENPPAAADTPQESGAEQNEAAAQERFERLKAKAEARMEETEPYLSDPLNAEEMYKAMVSGGRLDNRPCLVWRPVKDKL